MWHGAPTGVASMQTAGQLRLRFRVYIPLGLQRDNGKENGIYRDSRDYIGVIKKWL